MRVSLSQLAVIRISAPAAAQTQKTLSEPHAQASGHVYKAGFTRKTSFAESI
jgi:hypothetical protein